MDKEQTSETGRFRAYCQAHPRQTILWVVGLLGVLCVLTALMGRIGYFWHRYDLQAVGVDLELPAAPAGQAPDAKSQADMVYQANTPRLAVLISGGKIDAGIRAHPRSMVDQAMHFVRANKNVSALKYEVSGVHLDNRPCLQVSGSFRVQGTQAWLSGVFLIGASRQAHVICFYSTPDGARAGARVLSSIRFTGT